MDRQNVQQLQPLLGNQAVLALLSRQGKVRSPQEPADRPAATQDRLKSSRRESDAATLSPRSRETRSVQREDDVTTTSISETTDTGNKYTQQLVLNKTKARLTVRLAVNWVKEGTFADDAAFQKFIRKVKTAAYGYLDNKFKVVCTPTAAAAPKEVIELPIDFIIFDMDSGYTIRAHGGKPGSGSAMAEAGGDVYEYRADDTLEEGITYAHEFGHAILGASDEYANPAMPDRVLTNDHSIMANYFTQGKTEAEFKARHFQHIVTEVAKAFAGYTCGLREM